MIATVEDVRSQRVMALGDWFFAAMAATAALSVLAGFFFTFFAPLAAGSYQAGALVYAHAAAFFAWTALFAVQPVLIRRRRVRVHRRLGMAGAILAVVMFGLGIAIALTAAQRGVASGDPGAHPFLLITLSDMLLFGILAGCAIAWRRQPATHKRLMLLATAALMPAAFGRLFFFGFGIEHIAAMHLGANAFLLAGIMHDLWRGGRIHAAYLWGGSLLVGVHAGRVAWADSALWDAAAAWILAVL
jgi:uncharacterized membrane protein YozB (DUF420 family)